MAVAGNDQMAAMMQQMMMQMMAGQGGAAAPQADPAAAHMAAQQQAMAAAQAAQAASGGGWAGGGGKGKGGGKSKSNEQAACSVHGKNRGVRNLMDDGAGGMRCSPGFECQTGGGAPGGGGGCGKGGGYGADAGKGGWQKKVKLCTYFMAGGCSRGSACTFAHGEDDIGSYSDPTAVADGGKGSNMPGDWNCPGCGDHQFARNTECRKCGTPNPGGGGVSFGGAGGGAAWQDPAAAAGEPTMPCCIHGVERGVMSLTNDGSGGIRCKPGDECQQGGGGGSKAGGGMKGGAKGGGGKGDTKEWQKKVRLCTYFEQGSCSRGPGCTFAHGEADIGAYVNTLTGEVKGAGDKGKGAGKNPQGTGMLPGDWACPGCGDHQFARNAECRKCGTPNPNGGAPRASPY